MQFFLHIIIMYTIVKMWCFWKLFLLWHSVLIVNEFNFFSIIINLQCTCVYQKPSNIVCFVNCLSEFKSVIQAKTFEINSPWIITALRIKFMICVSLFKNWIIADKTLVTVFPFSMYFFKLCIFKEIKYIYYNNDLAGLLVDFYIDC